MVPLRAARVLPRPGSIHPAAITIDRRAPFPGLSVSLHTGRGGVPVASDTSDTEDRVHRRRGAERR